MWGIVQEIDPHKLIFWSPNCQHDYICRLDLKGIKWGHKDGALIQYDWCPYTKRHTHMEHWGIDQHSKKHVKINRESGHLKAKDRGLSKNWTSQHLCVGLPAYRLWEKKFKLPFCYSSSRKLMYKSTSQIKKPSQKQILYRKSENFVLLVHRGPPKNDTDLQYWSKSRNQLLVFIHSSVHVVRSLDSFLW